MRLDNCRANEYCDSSYLYKFDLESKTGSTCHDKLEVLDHLELATPTSLFTGCGKTIPKVPKSETNSVEIHFTSDARTQGQGFSLDWTAKEAECGGRVKTPTGTIQSPGYPTNHPINKQCKWFITGRRLFGPLQWY